MSNRIDFDQANAVAKKIGRALLVRQAGSRRQHPDWFFGTGIEKRVGRGNWFVSVRVLRGQIRTVRFYLGKPRGPVVIDGVPIVFMVCKMARPLWPTALKP